MIVVYHILRFLVILLSAFACAFFPLPYFIAGFAVSAFMTWLITGTEEGPGFWTSFAIISMTLLIWPIVMFEMGFELYRVSRTKE